MNKTFSQIVTRVNGDDILASWFNELASAGDNIENFLGGGFIPETLFTVANNQSAAANVTGLVFDPTKYRSFTIDYQIYRNTTGSGATELAESGILKGVYKTVSATWEMIPVGQVGDAGVTLTIVSATGQIQYTSTNITGTAATSKMSFSATTKGV
jgi:hypothetical protein